MSRSTFPQGALPLIVLKLLAQGGPMHGYAITLRIEELSLEALSVEEGSLYPALYRLAETGCVRAKWVTTENKRRARIYEITAKGRRELEAEEQRWRSATAAVERILRFA